MPGQDFSDLVRVLIVQFNEHGEARRALNECRYLRLVNDLSHDNSGRLEITFDQAKDFVAGLKSLTKKSEAHNLIKGRENSTNNRPFSEDGQVSPGHQTAVSPRFDAVSAQTAPLLARRLRLHAAR